MLSLSPLSLLLLSSLLLLPQKQVRRETKFLINLARRKSGFTRLSVGYKERIGDQEEGEGGGALKERGEGSDRMDKEKRKLRIKSEMDLLLRSRLSLLGGKMKKNWTKRTKIKFLSPVQELRETGLNRFLWLDDF